VNIILIVNMIESVSVLKTEFFSTRIEARLREAPSDLKILVCSAKVEVSPNAEPLRLRA